MTVFDKTLWIAFVVLATIHAADFLLPGALLAAVAN